MQALAFFTNVTKKGVETKHGETSKTFPVSSKHYN